MTYRRFPSKIHFLQDRGINSQFSGQKRRKKKSVQVRAIKQLHKSILVKPTDQEMLQNPYSHSSNNYKNKNKNHQSAPNAKAL